MRGRKSLRIISGRLFLLRIVGTVRKFYYFCAFKPKASPGRKKSEGVAE